MLPALYSACSTLEYSGSAVYGRNTGVAERQVQNGRRTQPPAWRKANFRISEKVLGLRLEPAGKMASPSVYSQNLSAWENWNIFQLGV